MFKGWMFYYKKKPVVTGDFDYYKIVFSLQTKDKVGSGRKAGLGEKLGERLGEKLGERLSANELKIIDLLKDNKVATIADVSESLSISTTAVEKNLAKLKSKGFIRRIGADRGGHWEIVQK